MNTLQDLPDSLLHEIQEYLTICERRIVLATCDQLWNQRHELQRNILSLAVHDKRDYRFLSDLEFLRPLVHLQRLDLQQYCTDEFLSLLEQHETLLPKLIDLRLVGSIGVSDTGLEALSHACPSLTYLDITFCRNTTYAGTFCLRDLGNKMAIRRQPAWMDGKFQTPFDNDGLHTYWCDGTFQFQRESQSSGFVCDLEAHEDSCHVGDKLQYNNFIPPRGWPEWSRFCYRPGVSLLKLSELHQGQRQVLVGQRLYGLKPPKDLPTLDQLQFLEVGASVYFGRNGDLLQEDHSIGDRYTMLSRMTILPLDELMPPDDLVQTNKIFCEEMKTSQQMWSLDGGEEFLHHVLRSVNPGDNG